MSSAPVPTGQSAPVEITDATHHGAWVVIATALGLVLGFACLLIRLYVRVIITPPFARDDYIHAASTVRTVLRGSNRLSELTVVRHLPLFSPLSSSGKSLKVLANPLNWSTH